MNRLALILVFAAFSLTLGNVCRAHQNRGNVLGQISFEQHLGAIVPLDTAFRDESGQDIRLAQLMNERPAVLMFAYYDCPNLCDVMMRSLAKTTESLSLHPGKDFDVVVVSISPKETPALANRSKRALLKPFRQAASGWHLLTGNEAEIRSVADAVGFHYTWDPKLGQYAHATGLVVLSPDGHISRYLYGMRFGQRDLRLALFDAGQGKIGSLVDQVLLFCYGYDPSTGQYSLLVWKVLRVAGVATVLLLGGGIGLFILRERAARRRSIEPRKEES